MNELIIEAIDHKLLISLNLFVNSDLRAVSKISGTVFPNTDLPYNNIYMRRNLKKSVNCLITQVKIKRTKFKEYTLVIYGRWLRQ